MKQTLELKLGQKLSLTPQLQQSIRLLQLSATELQAEIRENLDSNPFLEQVEAAGRDSSPSTQNIEPSSADNSASANNDAHAGSSDGADSGEFREDYTEPTHTPTRQEGGDSADSLIDKLNSASVSLRDHLVEQFRLLPLSRTDMAIGAILIDSIDESGYLTVSLDEIIDILADSVDVDVTEIEAVLHQVQNLDPAGVGARDLRECLLLQIKHEKKSDSASPIAAVLVDGHLELVGKRDITNLKKHTGFDEKQLAAAMQLIRELNPKPGYQIESEQVNYITPDVIIKQDNGSWTVALYRSYQGSLRVNQEYKTFIKRGDKSKDNQFMKERLQQAQWFIRCVENRESTVLRVSREIVEHQLSFLNNGETEMRPLVMRDIAEKLELHESTISRATTQKYALTPRGMLELRYFFSSHVKTSDGGTCSAVAIQAHIKNMVEEEDRTKPMSDNKIASILQTQGIQVARRTVAKYREHIQIPPSHQRKVAIDSIK